MLQRRRRKTQFQFDKLEGRAAPAIIATSAVLFSSPSSRLATIRGYTTAPTEPGQILEVKATEHLRNGHTIASHTFYTEVAPTIAEGRTGAFSVVVEAVNRQRFSLEGSFEVNLINITSREGRHVIERDTTTGVPVSFD
jgi:hypothetical protein